MNDKELSKLLEKYYDGDSTQEEELLLRDYFAQDTIPDGFETEKALFSLFAPLEEIPDPAPEFESKIIAGIDALEAGSRKISPLRSFLPYLSIAASLLVLVASYFFIVNRGRAVDTYSDPAIAYAETMKILMEVSTKINSGTRALEPVSKISEMTSKSFESINKSTDIIGRNLKSLDYLQQATEINKMGNTSDK